MSNGLAKQLNHIEHVICIYECMTHDKIVWLGAFGLMVFAHIRYGRVLLHKNLTNSTLSTNFAVISLSCLGFFLFCCAWKHFAIFCVLQNLMVIVLANTIYAYAKRMHGNGKRPEKKKIGAHKKTSVERHILAKQWLKIVYDEEKKRVPDAI